MRILSGLVLVAVLTAPAHGQTPPPAKPDPAEVRALSAQYELSNADASRKCPLRLEMKPAGPGFTLALDRKQCDPLFAFLGEVLAWTPGIAGAILFVRGNGDVVAEFTEGVGGVYEAIRENDAVYFLANLQFVDPAARVQISELFGDWNLARPGAAPFCRITLTDTVAGDEMFAVRVQPKCDASIERFGPSVWQFERGDIVLRAQNGDSLRFERQDGVWTKVPDRPRPLVMTRP